MRTNPAVSSVSALVGLLKQWSAKTGKGAALIEMCEADPDGFGAPFLTAVNEIMTAKDKVAGESRAAISTTHLTDKEAWRMLAELVDQALPELSSEERTALKREFMAESHKAS